MTQANLPDSPDDEEYEILRPSLVQKFKPLIEVEEGSSFTIEARAIASPEPQVLPHYMIVNFFICFFLLILIFYKIKWIHYEKVINENNHNGFNILKEADVHMYKLALNVNNCSEKVHAGIYKLVITNEGGSIEWSTQVNVKGNDFLYF